MFRVPTMLLLATSLLSSPIANRLIPVPVLMPELVLLAPWMPALIPKLACLAEALGPATRPAVFVDVPFDCGAL